MDNYSMDTLAIIASDILTLSESYQWDLGKMSNEVIEHQGYKALVDFSKRISDISGIKRSPSSLRIYAYVWKASNKLGLSKDLMFSTCKAIVFSDEPEKYALMSKNGSSFVDIRKQIYEDQKT